MRAAIESSAPLQARSHHSAVTSTGHASIWVYSRLIRLLLTAARPRPYGHQSVVVAVAAADLHFHEMVMQKRVHPLQRLGARHHMTDCHSHHRLHLKSYIVCISFSATFKKRLKVRATRLLSEMFGQSPRVYPNKTDDWQSPQDAYYVEPSGYTVITLDAMAEPSGCPLCRALRMHIRRIHWQSPQDAHCVEPSGYTVTS